MLIKESKARNLIFEILLETEIQKRLDLSNPYWAKFNTQNAAHRKKMGLYKVENIDNPNISTIVVDPKEYFEKFKNRSIDKKLKNVRENTKGIWFEVYAERITPLKIFDEKIEEKKKMV